MTEGFGPGGQEYRGQSKIRLGTGVLHVKWLDGSRGDRWEDQNHYFIRALGSQSAEIGKGLEETYFGMPYFPGHAAWADRVVHGTSIASIQQHGYPMGEGPWDLCSAKEGR